MKVTEHSNGDVSWEVDGKIVVVAVSQASGQFELPCGEDPEVTETVSLVPVYIDGHLRYEEIWHVLQEGLNDLVQNVATTLEMDVGNKEA